MCNVTCACVCTSILFIALYMLKIFIAQSYQFIEHAKATMCTVGSRADKQQRTPSPWEVLGPHLGRALRADAKEGLFSCWSSVLLALSKPFHYPPSIAPLANAGLCRPLGVFFPEVTQRIYHFFQTLITQRADPHPTTSSTAASTNPLGGTAPRPREHLQSWP